MDNNMQNSKDKLVGLWTSGNYYITPITDIDTLPIRHLVMWPDKPIDFVKLPDDDKGQHYGLYVEDTLVSVLSLFINDHSAQFRKFATLQSYQGKGYGTLLLNHVIAEATKEGAVEIWCNARTEKADYYRTFGGCYGIIECEFLFRGHRYVDADGCHFTTAETKSERG